MKLSIVIVSYNVMYFLEKCIGSVMRALNDIDGEIIVVDNNSPDKSVDLMRSRFPNVRLIANADNRGFAVACNQGLRIAQGEYALLLNPDTLVSEDTFRICIEFMDVHPEASACGVRMVDGTGRFLPESMRGIPSPSNAFFKMTGLGTLFPHSAFFNGYYAGNPDPLEMHEIPVLTGAYLFMRMAVIHEIGMLDEDYFMYGEDIDLCYRMVSAGYKNYYLPQSSIVHYKGESTKRASLRYVMHFYRAMMIYVSKHVRGIGGQLFRFMILLGIALRALIGGLHRTLRRLVPVAVDAVTCIGVLLAMRKVWAVQYFGDPGHFDQGFLRINIPLYTGLWLLSLLFAGAYDMRRRTRQVVYGMLVGTVIILIVYALLPLQYRSSRAIIFLSAFFITLVLLVLNALTGLINRSGNASRNVVIVGSQGEVRRIMELMNRVGVKRNISGWVAPDSNEEGEHLLGYLADLKDIVSHHGVREIIFSGEDLSYRDINSWMGTLGPVYTYRISGKDSAQIVGSDSKKEQGTLYKADVEFALAYPGHRRIKRLFDIFCALFLICLWPLYVIAGRGWSRYLTNVWRVLIGRRTWIGYHPEDNKLSELPVLRPGIFFVGEGSAFPGEASEVHMINYIYAREYYVWKDVDLFFRNINKINFRT